MAFDVSKFLALTALIATATGAACSSTNDSPADNGDGAAGSSQSGSGNEAGAPDPGSAGSESGGGTGDGMGGAGAGEGGGALGGAPVGGGSAGGEGGVSGSAECLGTPAAGGAGGAGGDVEPSLEDLCMDFFEPKCEASAEDYDPSYKVCEGVKSMGLPVVAMAVASCLKALSVTDACDAAKVAACFTDLVGTGCVAPDTEATCVAINANCDAVSVAKCQEYADLVAPAMYEGLAGCMDPGDEGWYDANFVGTCAERLDNCSGVKL